MMHNRPSVHDPPRRRSRTAAINDNAYLIYSRVTASRCVRANADGGWMCGWRRVERSRQHAEPASGFDLVLTWVKPSTLPSRAASAS
jgi:hypothetical protein